jgi:hypothetical protein
MSYCISFNRRGYAAHSKNLTLFSRRRDVFKNENNCEPTRPVRTIEKNKNPNIGGCKNIKKAIKNSAVSIIIQNLIKCRRKIQG